MGGHAHMVFLIGRGGQAVDGGGRGKLLVFRGQRGRRHMGHHVAGVEAGLGMRKAGSDDIVVSVSSAMRRSASAPVSAMARPACRRRTPPARHESCRPTEPRHHRGTPADCRRPHWPRSSACARRWPEDRGRRPSPAAGSGRSRGPAPCHRLPDARRGSRCRPSASRNAPATCICPGWGRSAWMRGVERACRNP
jgi:hypothetical protein